MNILLFSDLHITKNDIVECESVLNEILELCNQFKVKEVYDLGDTFDEILPESQCLDLFSNFVKKLNRKINIIAANSHESTTEDNSILNHFGILYDNVRIQKEFIDDNHMYCGHFILKESKLNFNASHSMQEFKNYKYVFLGHQHSFEKLRPNVCHLGSCRWIDFGEAKDKAKAICLIENYKEPTEKVHFIALKSPYSLIDIKLHSNSVKILQNGAYHETNTDAIASPGAPGAEIRILLEHILNNLAFNTKIRLIFEDFETYKAVLNDLSKYKNKFVLFREKKNFTMSDNLVLPQKENINLKECLAKYLETNKISEEIKQILLEETNEQ